ETRDRARAIIARYPVGRQRSALLPLLHLVQAEEGYVSPAGIGFCADVLGLTEAEVSAVATIYTMYKRKTAGDWHVRVSTNTTCARARSARARPASRRSRATGWPSGTASRCPASTRRRPSRPRRRATTSEPAVPGRACQAHAGTQQALAVAGRVADRRVRTPRRVHRAA